MGEQFTREQMFDALFMNLVMMFHTAAMQHMGKLKNPLTDKIERDLLQAQMSIDMLDMLKAKTKGNLSDEETRFLDRVISELKLNYVDEAEKDRKAQQEIKKAEAKEGEQPSGAEVGQQSASAAPSTADAKGEGEH
ncbi:MAG: DUF1844 domain-containing protein [candidate division KSB1 bacterium]|nr:DUF1844 domain-containing protein [candidate division KSB1 bacterium]MDZ7386309.1 DUF1844 domain-containing protein [candidate division KSB1 bacterium]MDZ7393339.1 DUF1844 domain-containing protein [candidate division KSB1 bacterium]